MAQVERKKVRIEWFIKKTGTIFKISQITFSFINGSKNLHLVAQNLRPKPLFCFFFVFPGNFLIKIWQQCPWLLIFIFPFPGKS